MDDNDSDNDNGNDSDSDSESHNENKVERSGTGSGPDGVAGTLIIESLRVGTELGVPLTVDRINRVQPGDTSTDQPAVWTLLEFRAADGDLPALAGALADSLDESGGWYCDLRTDAETWVIFAGRVFRYPRGDPAGRAEAQEH